MRKHKSIFGLRDRGEHDRIGISATHLPTSMSNNTERWNWGIVSAKLHNRYLEHCNIVCTKNSEVIVANSMCLCTATDQHTTWANASRGRVYDKPLHKPFAKLQNLWQLSDGWLCPRLYSFYLLYAPMAQPILPKMHWHAALDCLSLLLSLSRAFAFQEQHPQVWLSQNLERENPAK